jgi:hypothetical protein
MDELLRPAFEVDGEYDPSSGPPMNGLEYLRHVRWEASQLPDITVSQVDPRQFDNKQTFFISTKKNYPATSPDVIPSSKWQTQFMEDFLRLREAVLKLRTDIPPHLHKPKLPGRKNKQAWIKFCFGSTGENKTSPQQGNEEENEQKQQINMTLNASKTSPCEISCAANDLDVKIDEELDGELDEEDNDGEAQTGEQEGAVSDILKMLGDSPRPMKFQQQQQQQQQQIEIVKHSLDCSPSRSSWEPLLGIILQLDDATTTLLVNYLIEWLEDNELNEERIAWLFALLLVLDKPLDPDTAASLQALLRKCCVARARLTNPRDSIVASLNILITIITKFFGQFED